MREELNFIPPKKLSQYLHITTVRIGNSAV